MIELYVINKKNDIKRLNKIKLNFKNYNLNVIEAIQDNIGWKGCFLSHKKCIQIAIENRLDYIIIIEDDCKPSNNFDIHLDKILQFLKNNMNDWDIFLGGVTNVWFYNKIYKITNNLNVLNINKGKTTHFIIYNKSSYEFFINQKINTPIDKCWHHKLKALTCIPFIATQFDGISSIENKYVNYVNKFKSIELYLKKKIKEER